MSERVEKIRQVLQELLAPSLLDIYDDSHSHAGHRGASERGGGHFFVTIVADAFVGKTAVRRHQLVYASLGELMQTDIHALGLKAFTPEEFQQQQLTYSNQE